MITMTVSTEKIEQDKMLPPPLLLQRLVTTYNTEVIFYRVHLWEDGGGNTGFYCIQILG